MTGGGFGGGVLALVEQDARVHTQEAVARAFADLGHDAPTVVVAVPGAGARRMSLAQPPGRPWG
ncbi:hypothetical protein [Janibacter alittae]|uniref:hypothetical protein n=1 Tax=Janibacter alittae TaxID=3115209 RepID=UPI003BB085B2